jgi:hypothetical protein
MNTNTINKDNVGSSTLLAAMFLTITVALFSGTASAKSPQSATNIAATKAQAQATVAKTTTDTIVITATRLK